MVQQVRLTSSRVAVFITQHPEVIAVSLSLLALATALLSGHTPLDIIAGAGSGGTSGTG